MHQTSYRTGLHVRQPSGVLRLGNAKARIATSWQTRTPTKCLTVRMQRRLYEGDMLRRTRIGTSCRRELPVHAWESHAVYGKHTLEAVPVKQGMHNCCASLQQVADMDLARLDLLDSFASCGPSAPSPFIFMSIRLHLLSFPFVSMQLLSC